MKTTVLHASKKLAEEVSANLLSYRTQKGNPMFSRTEIENGFEISGKRKEGDKLVKEVVFRYINDDGRQRFEYNEKLLSF